MFPSISEAYLRISDDNNKNQNVCKMYTIEKEVRLPVNSDLYDSCFWNTAKKLRAKTYFLEYKAENKEEAMYRKIVFDMPNTNFYSKPPRRPWLVLKNNFHCSR